MTMNWELIVGMLPWLLLLACPVSMFWMMRSMSHGEGGDRNKDPNAPALVPARVSTDEEIRALRERLARLEAQNQGTENWR